MAVVGEEEEALVREVAVVLAAWAAAASKAEEGAVDSATIQGAEIDFISSQDWFSPGGDV